MKLNENHPLNQGLFKHLQDRKGLRFEPTPIMAPDQHPNPYMEAGSHPDTVQRVWDDLGGALPVNCRAIVYGTPALVHPEAGVVLAIAYGTGYIIRVPDELISQALEASCKTEREWTGGGQTNLETEMGPGWMFGCWAEQESQWLAKLFADLGQAL